MLSKEYFNDVEKIIPQKKPMALLDRIISCDPEAKTLSAEVVITEKSMFFDAATGAVPVWVGVEYMAQSIAAFANLSRAKSVEDVKIGFLLGTRNFQCHVTGFTPQQRLQVSIHELYMDEPVASFDCSIHADGKLLAQAQITVYQPDSIDEFFQQKMTPTAA